MKGNTKKWIWNPPLVDTNPNLRHATIALVVQQALSWQSWVNYCAIVQTHVQSWPYKETYDWQDPIGITSQIQMESAKDQVWAISVKKAQLPHMFHRPRAHRPCTQPYGLRKPSHQLYLFSRTADACQACQVGQKNGQPGYSQPAHPLALHAHSQTSPIFWPLLLPSPWYCISMHMQEKWGP